MENKEKEIVIFDTNFVIGNKKNFAIIVKQLQEKADVFLPEIVLRERLSQKWRELKKRFDEIERIKDKYSDLISSLQYSSTFKNTYKKQEEFAVKSYEELFGKDKIIPIDKTAFEIVLDRAYKKLPLFSEDKNVSDKGFKDTVLWLSLIKFFRAYQTTSNIVFMTDDKAFICYQDDLQKEFKKETKLNITIQNCDYYKKLLGETDKAETTAEQDNQTETEIDLEFIRTRIDNALSNFTQIYADRKWQYRFTIDKTIDKTQALWIVNNIETQRQEYLLSKHISVTTLFSDEYKISEKYYISIETLDEIVEIKKYLEKSFRQGLEPFYIEFANRINRCVGYVFDDSDLPF